MHKIQTVEDRLHHRAFLGLGSNQGDRQYYLKEALRLLEGRELKVAEASAVYETEPWGFVSGSWFLNQVVAVDTSLDRTELFERCQSTEKKLGRLRSGKPYSSRLIDIDLLLFNDDVYSGEGLVIPHPRLQERKFVLLPLREIAPQLRHPIFQKTMQQLYEECRDDLQVRKLEA